MASAKPTATTRRSTSRSSSGQGAGGEHHISPARWGGVALVVAALVGAIALAVLSPGRPASPAEPMAADAGATPTMPAAVPDGQVPTLRPRIVSPVEGPTGEIEIEVTVEVPEEDMPRRSLTLVVLRGDTELGAVERPRTGSRVPVPGIRLVQNSVNELTAALKGPGGLGPRSEPVLVTQDRDAPALAITSPAMGEVSYDKTISVTVTSEPGAEVLVSNAANEFDKPVVVGPGGEVTVGVPLSIGRNRIVVESVDQAGLKRQDKVRVVRRDGTPQIKVSAPKRVKRSSLPRTVRIVVVVTDKQGQALQDATVAYTLGAGMPSLTHEAETDERGRSTWSPEIVRSDPPADVLELGVTVTSPYGFSRTERRQIRLS